MRVLLIKTSSMGDIVHNLPVVADLRRAQPDVVIDWVVEESYVDLVRMVVGIDRIIPVALRRWRRTPHRRATHDERRDFGHALRTERYDVVLDTQGLLKSALIGRRARLTHDGHRVGFSFGLVRETLARLFYDRGYAVDRRLHAIERMRMLAAQVFGYADRDLGPPRFELDVAPGHFDWIPATEGVAVPYLVLLQATARAEKAWPQERWAGLVRIVAQAGFLPILPSGNATERSAAEAIVALARQQGDGAIDALVAPSLSLAACASLIAGARGVVGVDTGLLHIAAALDVPMVGLFGATPRWRYAPYWSARAINLGSFGELGAQPPLEAVVDGLQQLGVLAPSP